jgi:hypothetical protein
VRRVIPASASHILIAIASSFIWTSSTAAQSTTAACEPKGTVVRLPGIAEASGLAVSRRVPGRLWTHNDSGQPVLFALDSQGAISGQLRITGASVEDWEAIAVGACGGGSCLYIGDIGDNDAKRRAVTIYRVPEPDAGARATAAAEVIHAAYPDGAHDAEALLVSGDGRLYIVTKGETGPIGLYRFPADLKAGATVRLERVGAPMPASTADSRITDGSVSADGRWVVLRTRSTLTFYRASDLFAGAWRAATRVNLASIKESQGEGIALGPGNTVFVAGEGGGKKQPGTFARFSCAPQE